MARAQGKTRNPGLSGRNCRVTYCLEISVSASLYHRDHFNNNINGSKPIDRPTSSRAIFHDPNRNRAEFERLTRRGRDEIDGDGGRLHFVLCRSVCLCLSFFFHEGLQTDQEVELTEGEEELLYTSVLASCLDGENQGAGFLFKAAG